LLNYVLRFYRWDLYLARAGYHVPLWDNLHIYFSGFALTTTPGKAGEIIRGFFLKKFNVPFKVNLACFFSERLSDLIAVILLCLVGLSHNLKYFPFIIVGFGLVILIFVCVFCPQWIGHVQKKLNPDSKLYKILGYGYDLLVQTQAFHQPKFFILTLTISCVAWAAEALGFFYTLYILDIDMALSQAIFIYALSMLVGALSFLPGGLGGAEATSITLLTLSGVSLEQATAVTIFMRLATLWFAVGLGIISFVYYRRKCLLKKDVS
jgi:uncharacterized protein (TIRG00374 family)